ncbi:MAG: capsid assembly protein [Bacteroidota bacterium]
MYYEDSQDAPDGELPETDPGATPQVPEKFRDPRTGGVRTEALLRAYMELERRMHSMVKVPGPDCSPEDRCAFHRALGVPDSPDGYDIASRHELLTSDPQVNSRLHQAGFTPEQAQLVYDLAHDCVLPMLGRMSDEYDQRRHLDRLKDYYGGDARWSETARQVSAWGKANLPDEVYQALAGSSEGVMAMERMMASGEPAMGRAPQPKDEAPSEAELKRMMQDPRYWKNRDPAFIDKVSSGFRRLYGE